MATVRRRESAIEEKPKILEAVKINPSASCQEPVKVDEKAPSTVKVRVTVEELKDGDNINSCQCFANICLILSPAVCNHRLRCPSRLLFLNDRTRRASSNGILLNETAIFVTAISRRISCLHCFQPSYYQLRN